jgi:hypothetical protein
MRLRNFKRLLKAESHGSDPSEQDLDPVREVVEKSRIALEEAEMKSAQADVVTRRARRIEERNGFGQLAEKLLIDRERERRRHLGHGGTA